MSDVPKHQPGQNICAPIKLLLACLAVSVACAVLLCHVFCVLFVFSVVLPVFCLGRMFEVFESATELYIVMECCTGGELFDRIKEKVSESASGRGTGTGTGTTTGRGRHGRTGEKRDM